MERRTQSGSFILTRERSANSRARGYQGSTPHYDKLWVKATHRRVANASLKYPRYKRVRYGVYSISKSGGIGARQPPQIVK